MQPEQRFEIHVFGYHSSVDEARQVKNTPISELPSLSDEEREAAKKLSVPTESYQRMKLAGAYGRQRMEKKGKALGELVQRILEPLGPGYNLEDVTWQGARVRWLLRVYAPNLNRAVGVPVPFELADDVVDAGILSAVRALDDLIREGLGREETIAKSN